MACRRRSAARYRPNRWYPRGRRWTAADGSGLTTDQKVGSSNLFGRAKLVYGSAASVPERPARWDGHGLSDRAGFGARRNGDSARRDRRRRSIGARRWGCFGDSLSRRPAASASVVPRRHGSRGGRRWGRRRCGGAGSRRPCRKLDHRVYHQREQYHPDCAGRHQSRRTAVPRRRGLGQASLSISVSARSKRWTVAAWSWSPTSFRPCPHRPWPACPRSRCRA